MGKLDGIVRGFYSVKRILKRRTPEMLMAAGVVGIGYGTYKVIKDAHTDGKIKEEHEKALQEIKDKNLPEKERRDAVVRTYIHTGLEYGKHYAIGVGSIAAGTGAVLGAAGIFKGRLKKVSAELVGVTTTLGQYRDRWKEKVGKEEEDRVFRGLETRDISRRELDENGNEVETHETVNVRHKDNVLPHEYFFTENQFAYCVSSGGLAMNGTQLEHIRQNLTEHKFKKRGFITEGEILDALGYKGPKTKESYDFFGRVYRKDVPIDNQQIFTWTYENIVTVRKDGTERYEDVIVIRINCEDNIMEKRFGR